MFKNIYLSLVLVFAATLGFAQIDRTTAPEPGPAPEINIAEPATFTLKNGLKVFVVENHKLPRVAFSLSLDKDPILEKDKTGYVSMAGQMLMKGTQNRTKAELDEEIDFIGANINTSSSGMYATSLTKHQDKLMELMTDILFNPSFPEEELDKLKKQTLSGLAASKDDPNSIASNVRRKLVYGENHPYGEFETEASVENITLEDCKNYYETYFKPNIAYLAIVGDITPKEAKKLIKKNFSDWEKAEVPSNEYEMPQAPEETYVALVDREASVQSVINVAYPVDLKVGSPDVIKARVLNQILGGGFSSRLMQNLREDKAFTYGARSSLSSDELVGSFTASASVRNEVTDSAVNEFIYELEKIAESGVTENELMAAKASINGSFARSLESPQTVASFAINTAKYDLPEDYYANYLKRLDAVSIEDIQSTAKEYILANNAHVIVVGKGADVGDKLKQFGAVKYFDRKGNEYDPSKTAKIPEGVTVETIFNDYIKAIGGEDKLNTVKTMKTVYSGSIQGRTLSITEIKTDEAYAQTVGMGPMVMSESKFDGENLKVMQQGQEMPVPEEAKKNFKMQSLIFPEMHYDEMGIKTELTGIKDVDGQKAYAIDVTMPSGQIATTYYSVDSGLKLKSSTTQKTPRGEMTASETITDYTEKDGIKIPSKKDVNQGFQMELSLDSVEINADIPADTFK